MRSIVYHQFRKELHIIKADALHIISAMVDARFRVMIYSLSADDIQQRLTVVDEMPPLRDG